MCIRDRLPRAFLPTWVGSSPLSVVCLISLLDKRQVLDLFRFFLTSAPFVVVATIVTLFQARLTFGVKGLVTDEERKIAAELVAGFDEKESGPSVRFFWCSVLLLLGFIVCLAGQSALPWDLDELGMGFVALFFCGACAVVL